MSPSTAWFKAAGGPERGAMVTIFAGSRTRWKGRPACPGDGWTPRRLSGSESDCLPSDEAGRSHQILHRLAALSVRFAKGVRLGPGLEGRLVGPDGVRRVELGAFFDRTAEEMEGL